MSPDAWLACFADDKRESKGLTETHICRPGQNQSMKISIPPLCSRTPHSEYSIFPILDLGHIRIRCPCVDQEGSDKQADVNETAALTCSFKCLGRTSQGRVGKGTRSNGRSNRAQKTEPEAIEDRVTSHHRRHHHYHASFVEHQVKNRRGQLSLLSLEIERTKRIRSTVCLNRPGSPSCRELLWVKEEENTE